MDIYIYPLNSFPAIVCKPLSLSHFFNIKTYLIFITTSNTMSNSCVSHVCSVGTLYHAFCSLLPFLYHRKMGRTKLNAELLEALNLCKQATSVDSQTNNGIMKSIGTTASVGTTLDFDFNQNIGPSYTTPTNQSILQPTEAFNTSGYSSKDYVAKYLNNWQAFDMTNPSTHHQLALINDSNINLSKAFD